VRARDAGIQADRGERLPTKVISDRR
jgi:hypothetical protein